MTPTTKRVKHGGRKKGTPNKVTSLLRNDILEAGAKAHKDGMVGYLTEQANKNPVAFMTLLGKVLPTQVEGTGEGGAITVEVVRFTGGAAGS